MNSYLKFSKKSVLLIASVIVLGSCKDTWNEHYSFKPTDSKYPVAKIAETLEGIDGFDKFYKVLAETKMCNRNGTPLDVTYLELLSEDQFLTVWAPSNSSLPDSVWDRYMKKKRDKSPAEHREVGEQFLANHIARFKHTAGEGEEEMVNMLNGKAYQLTADGINGQAYHADDRDIRCSNGILHCIDGKLDYLPNLYEYITTIPEYKDIFGDWFRSYTKRDLDLTRSKSRGEYNDNGEKIYVDSVFVEYSDLMEEFGEINNEDSVYAVVLPTPEVWNSVYGRIKEYYTYNEVETNNDSLQKFYTYSTMMGDMFYNVKSKKVNRYLPDSVYSTKYKASDNRIDKKPYHIFSHPYDKNTGLFGSSIDSVKCSNGIVYFINSWPFADTLTFLRQIKLEAENYTLAEKRLTQTSIAYLDENGNVEKTVRVMRISQEGRKDWDAEYKIYDHLKGRYSVKMITHPDIVNGLPNFIHPKVTYQISNDGEDDLVLADSTFTEQIEYRPGKFRDQTSAYMFITSMNKMDTILVGNIEIPYCKYGMSSARLFVTISSGVNEMNSEKYSSELWLDCIILDPIVE